MYIYSYIYIHIYVNVLNCEDDGAEGVQRHISHARTSQVALTNEASHEHIWVMSHKWMTHVTNMTTTYKLKCEHDGEEGVQGFEHLCLFGW